jgi:hypothetical protein
MYGVFHSCLSYELTVPTTRVLMKDTLTQNFNDALIYAEVLASEHAEKVFVPKNILGYRYAACGNGIDKTGFTFRTSDGSQVWYTVKRIS